MTVHTAANLPSPGVADRIGRGLLVVNIVATVGAFITGVVRVGIVADDRLWVEAWRTSGFLLFACLFALLVTRPRGQRGVWEVVLVQKSGLVIFSFAVGNIPEARLAGAIDLGLVLTTAAAYVLCRGWTAWRAAEPRQG